MSVHSEVLNVTVNGNTLTRHNIPLMSVTAILTQRPQVSFLRNGGTDQNPLFDVSYPMDADDHRKYAALIHRQSSENKLGRNHGKPDNEPPPTGPRPTNPRGSGGTVVEKQNTLAIAA